MPKFRVRLNIDDIIEAEDEVTALEEWAEENVEWDGDIYDLFEVEELD